MIETRFKETEIGMIPEDWEFVPIGDLAKDMADGPFGSNLKTEHYTKEKETRVIQLSNIGELGWVDANVKYTTFEHAKTLQRCIATPGCILVAKMMPAGRSILCPSHEKQFILGSDVVRIVPNEKLNALYYVYASKSAVYIDQIAENTQGSTRQRTSISKLKKICLPYPSYVEQSAIADALSDVDGLLRELGELIAKKKAIKMGMMQELLTVEAVPGKEGAFRPKRRLEGFEGDWVEKRLGEVASLYNGYGFKSDTYSKIGKYKIVTIGNVQNGCLSMDDYNCITKVPDDIRDYQILKLGDILVSMTGNVGRVCRVDVTDCLLNQRVGLLKVDSNGINDDFFFTLLNSNTFESSMIEKGHGAAQPNIGKGEIEGYSFFIPISIAEQTAIAEVLSDMDAEIAALEAKRAKYEQVKNGMMQELLTGKIRLV